MFELCKAATRLPQLQLVCETPAYFAFADAARSGALGFTLKRICSPQLYDGAPRNFYRSFFNHNQEQLK